jgi:hypothetical protein
VDIVGRLQNLRDHAHFFCRARQQPRHPIERIQSGATSLAQRIGGSVAGLRERSRRRFPGRSSTSSVPCSLFYFLLRDGAALLRWLMRSSPLPDLTTFHRAFRLGIRD